MSTKGFAELQQQRDRLREGVDQEEEAADSEFEQWRSREWRKFEQDKKIQQRQSKALQLSSLKRAKEEIETQRKVI